MKIYKVYFINVLTYLQPHFTIEEASASLAVKKALELFVDVPFDHIKVHEILDLLEVTWQTTGKTQ